MFTYCQNNPVNKIDQTGEMAIVDDAIALGLLAGLGLLVVATAAVSALEQGDPHHVLHGSNGGHREGWGRFGIDPNDPDGPNWEKLLPILEEVYRNGVEATRKVVNKLGDTVTYYVKEFTDEGVEVVLKVWKSAEQGIEKISDAWARILQ